jgi:hypothetical protein
MATGLERPTESQELDGIFIPAKANKALALAELFCQLFCDEQAAFLDHVAMLSGGWERPACFQWRNMEDYITPKARDLLKEMYDHTEKEPAAAPMSLAEAVMFGPRKP